MCLVCIYALNRVDLIDFSLSFSLFWQTHFGMMINSFLFRIKIGRGRYRNENACILRWDVTADRPKNSNRLQIFSIPNRFSSKFRLKCWSTPKLSHIFQTQKRFSHIYELAPEDQQEEKRDHKKHVRNAYVSLCRNFRWWILCANSIVFFCFTRIGFFVRHIERHRAGDEEKTTIQLLIAWESLPKYEIRTLFFLRYACVHAHTETICCKT